VDLRSMPNIVMDSAALAVANAGESATELVAKATLEAVWPELSTPNFAAMIVVNVGALIGSIVLLRVIWKPSTQDKLDQDKEMHAKIEKIQAEYGTFGAEEAIEGNVMGTYDADWKTTFDFKLVIFMFVTFIGLMVWTGLCYPELLTDYMFWLMQLPKVGVMMLVALLGGLTCRYFCPTDTKGYITTSKHNVFKVNYTRKFQHFAAYMVPLVITYKSTVTGPIVDAWGDWFTLLAFTLLIKPVRENCKFFMLQFNSLDRPEDRPNTLLWIIGGNILPGLFMIIFWRWLLASTNQESLAFIFVFITGIGDGLAEPVGIWTGKHKYWCSAIGGDRKYRRSLEGSACVFISSLVFTTCWYSSFTTPVEYWITMIILPPLMTFAEAKSPHTMDTPFLMGLGGLTIWLVVHMKVFWVDDPPAAIAAVSAVLGAK